MLAVLGHHTNSFSDEREREHAISTDIDEIANRGGLHARAGTDSLPNYPAPSKMDHAAAKRKYKTVLFGA